MTTEVHLRRDTIRRLIRSQVISTQEELGKLLEKDTVIDRCKVAVPGRKRLVGFGVAYDQAVGIRAE